MRKKLPQNRLKPDSERHIVEELDEKEPVEKEQITGAMLLSYKCAYYGNLKAMFGCFSIISFFLGIIWILINTRMVWLFGVLSIVFFCLYLKNKKKSKNIDLSELYLEKHSLKSKYSFVSKDEDGEETYYVFEFDRERKIRINKNPQHFLYYKIYPYNEERIFNSAVIEDTFYLLFLKNRSNKIRLALPEKFYELKYEDFTEVEGRYYAIQQKAEERFEKERSEIRQKLNHKKEDCAEKSLPPELKKLKKSKKAFNVFTAFSLVALVFTVIGIFSEFIAFFNPFVQPVWLIIPMAVATIRLIISGSAIKKMPLISDDYDETKKKQKKLKRLNALLIISDFALYIAVWVVVIVFHIE